ncbi:hypothetical protein ACH4ZX_03785 [Streptomyces sp. NPDC020490]|uniref:hypothetical protein n=1 Tax=Streptomyces sp. NPDC020490 TaxID=3365078 RepID=UPI0037AB14ED
MPRLPRCAWTLIASLLLISHHTIGTTATIGFLFAAAGWVVTTPAPLVVVASLAAWHLTSRHTPHRRRAHA